jgi:hypothetical protein
VTDSAAQPSARDAELDALREEIDALVETHVAGGNTHPAGGTRITRDPRGRRYASHIGGKARYLDCTVSAYSRIWAVADSSDGGGRQQFKGPDALRDALAHAYGRFWGLGTGA